MTELKSFIRIMCFDTGLFLTNVASTVVGGLILATISAIITYLYYTVAAYLKARHMKHSIAIVKSIIHCYGNRNENDKHKVQQNAYLRTMNALVDNEPIILRVSVKGVERTSQRVREVVIKSAKMFLKDYHPDKFEEKELTDDCFIVIASDFAEGKELSAN